MAAMKCKENVLTIFWVSKKIRPPTLIEGVWSESVSRQAGRLEAASPSANEKQNVYQMHDNNACPNARNPPDY